MKKLRILQIGIIGAVILTASTSSAANANSFFSIILGDSGYHKPKYNHSYSSKRSYYGNSGHSGSRYKKYRNPSYRYKDIPHNYSYYNPHYNPHYGYHDKHRDAPRYKYNKPHKSKHKKYQHVRGFNSKSKNYGHGKQKVTFYNHRY